MLKRSILLLSALFITSALAGNNDNLFVGINNLGLYNNAGNVGYSDSAHNLRYVITTPASESIVSPYASTSGIITPEASAAISLVRTNASDKPLTAHLKVTDPEAGERIVWEGDISEDVTTKQTSYVVNFVDSWGYHVAQKINSNNFLIGVAINSSVVVTHS
jgi:hypothetical protein